MESLRTYQFQTNFKAIRFISHLFSKLTTLPYATSTSDFTVPKLTYCALRVDHLHHLHNQLFIVGPMAPRKTKAATQKAKAAPRKTKTAPRNEGVTFRDLQKSIDKVRTKELKAVSKGRILKPKYQKEKGRLLRGFYGKLNKFCETDEMGYPLRTILSYDDVNDEMFTPTIMADHHVPLKAWSTQEKYPLKGWTRDWPIKEVETLLDTWVGDCVLCGRKKKIRCKCSHEAWNAENDRKWPSKFSIQSTESRGYGLHSMVPFDRDEPLGEAIGMLPPAHKHTKESLTNYCIAIQIGTGNESVLRRQEGRDELRCFINNKYCGNAFRFLNHSCEPNARFEVGWRCGNRRIMAVVANRRIEPGEEITIDYGSEWLQGKHQMYCQCGTKSCLNPAKARSPDEMEMWDGI